MTQARTAVRSLSGSMSGRPDRLRYRLLRSGCISALAIAALAGGSQARAQGFLGTGNVDAGAVSISTDASTITVGSQNAVITWTPDDTSGSGNINFLPNGNSATFNGTGQVGNYTVLNRIIPVDAEGAAAYRTVELNGLVRSTIDGTNPGGNVWFYSPGGILVGSTGQFDVGGLVLTTNDILYDSENGLFGSNGEIQFRRDLNAPTNASVQIASGAVINALTPSSYLAVVSPRIVQGGSVNVDGSAAYVAAESADVRINAGLFDINVLVGSDDGNGIVHESTGSTGGPATDSASDAQRVYLVAVPKSAAMTMLLSGSIGYTAATTATNEAGAVVLAAGYDVLNGNVSSNGSSFTTTAQMEGTTFTSRVDGYATGGLNFSQITPGTVSFQQGAYLYAATASTDIGGTLLSTGDFSLVVNDGNATLNNVDVTGNLFVDAFNGDVNIISASGSSYVGLYAAGDLTVNTATSTDGFVSMSARGDIEVSTSATGGEGVSLSTDSGAIVAGTLTGGLLLPSGGDEFGVIVTAPQDIDITSIVSGGKAAVLSYGYDPEFGYLPGTGPVTVVNADVRGNFAIIGDNGITLNGGTVDGQTLLAGFDTLEPLFGEGLDLDGLFDTPPVASLGSIAFSNLQSGSLTALTDVDLSFGGTSAITGEFLGSAGTTITQTTGALTAGSADLTAGDLATLNDVSATTGDLLIDAANLNSFTQLVAARDIILDVPGTVTLASVDAGRNFDFSTNGSVTSLSATSVVADGTAVGLASETIDIGSLQAGEAGFVARDLFIDSAQTDTDLTLISSNSATLGILTAGDEIIVDNSSVNSSLAQTLSVTSAQAGGPLSLFAFGGVTVGSATTTGTGLLRIGSTKGIDVTSVSAGGVVNLRVAATGFTGVGDGPADGGLAVDSISAVGSVTGFNSASGITLGSVVSTTGGIDLRAPQGAVLVTTDIAAPGAIVVEGQAIDLTAINSLSLGDVEATAGNLAIRSGGALTLGTGTASGALILRAQDDLTTSNLTADGSLIAFSEGGAVTLGNVVTGTGTGTGGIGIVGAAAVTAGTLNSDLGIAARSQNGSVNVGDTVSSGGSVRFTAGSTMNIGNVQAAGGITLNAAGDIDGGNLTAGVGTILSPSGGTDLAPSGIASGFTNLGSLVCDDCSSNSLSIGFLVNYFGALYNTTYASSNGYITFGAGQNSFTPQGLGASYSGLPIIAAFFADVDTRNPLSAPVVFGTGSYAGRDAFAVTWDGVGYYSSSVDKLNRFQLILTNRSDTGSGNFDIYFNYASINWETGSADGGELGLGGTSAAVGYNAGTGNAPGTFFELLGSQVPGTFLNNGTAPLVTTTNNGTPGQLLFQVRNGLVAEDDNTPRISVNNKDFGGSGNVSLGNLSAPDVIEVKSGGAISIDSATSGKDMTFEANIATQSPPELDRLGLFAIAADLLPGTFTAGSLIAENGSITITAPGAATFLSGGEGSNVAYAQSISVTSGDIVIEDRYQFGSAGLSDITLTNGDATRRTYVGGSDTEAGYSLSQAEFDRISGRTLTVEGPLDANFEGGPLDFPPDVIVRDLTLNAGETFLPGNGALTIRTNGTLFVEGAVRLSGVTDDFDFTLLGDRAVVVLNGSGLVDMRGANNALAGNLLLDGDFITAATQQAIDDIIAAPNIAARDARLAQNDGIIDDEGMLRAGSISFNVGSGLYIQNTGAGTEFDDRRGFTANSVGGLSARNDLEDELPEVVVNGRLVNPAGGFFTGRAVIERVTVNGRSVAPDVAFGSTINGCIIANVATCGALPPVVQQTLPDNGQIIGSLNPADPATLQFPPVSIQLQGFEPSSLDPLIDEPITGSGNDDLWQDPCLPGAGENCPSTGE